VIAIDIWEHTEPTPTPKKNFTTGSGSNGPIVNTKTNATKRPGSDRLKVFFMDASASKLVSDVQEPDHALLVSDSGGRQDVDHLRHNAR
jgi:hypothetical protein